VSLVRCLAERILDFVSLAVSVYGVPLARSSVVSNTATLDLHGKNARLRSKYREIGFTFPNASARVAVNPTRAVNDDDLVRQLIPTGFIEARLGPRTERPELLIVEYRDHSSHNYSVDSLMVAGLKILLT